MYGYSRAAIYGVDHEYTTFFCLFQLAGAAQSLGAGAILVNPRNISDVAIAIKDALDMTEGYRESAIGITMSMLRHILPRFGLIHS